MFLTQMGAASARGAKKKINREDGGGRIVNHKLRKEKENKLEKQKYPYIAATLNPEILVRVVKIRSGSGRGWLSELGWRKR